MASEVDAYLKDVKDNLRLDAASEREIISELETHAEERLLEMREAGLSDEEAAEKCLGLLGSARLVARQIYEAHSQGTWRQALLAALPHLFFAALFALKWWNIGWLPVVLGVAAATAIYGWCHGKPNWLFPWLGYSMLPVVITGLLLLYLPIGWAWVTILLYVPLVIWLICYITIKVINSDWLYSALMLLPVPSLVGWFVAAELEDKFTRFNLKQLNEFAPWIGLSFLVLALTVAMFLRIRQRHLRLVVLAVSEVLTLIIIASAGSLSFPVMLALVFLILASLSGPALLDHWMRHGGRPAIT
ncbi:MAG: hypothetical protein JSV77_02750 [Dehalococcoidales bacterium]|nr:MAG: hypothetical protein JSV77_02750 [Dehalococcoidales bacterium]